MKNLTFLDTETTGRGPDDRLIQLCMMGEADEPYNKLFKPPVPITFEAMSVHHITNEQISDKIPFKGSLDSAYVQKVISYGIVVAHNAPFDIEMLKREEIEVGEFIDTLKVAQILWDLPMYKLQYLRYRFGLKIDAKAHDAEGDVAVLMELFNLEYREIEQQYLKLFGDKDVDYEKMHEFCIEKMIIISGEPVLLRRMPFGKHKDIPFKDVPKDYLKWMSGQKDIDADLMFTVKHYLRPELEAQTGQLKI